MDNNLRFGVAHIVEWLRSSDVIRTGWDLFNELEPIGIMSKPPVPVDFHRVKTKEEFLALLRQFEEEYRQNGRVPLLHIETHGGHDGIGGDDEIAWPELMEALIPHLLDQRGLFERLRREYFFINQFPENDARFDVTFEQCWPDGMELRIE